MHYSGVSVLQLSSVFEEAHAMRCARSSHVQMSRVGVHANLCLILKETWLIRHVLRMPLGSYDCAARRADPGPARGHGVPRVFVLFDVALTPAILRAWLRVLL